jgi:fatty acid desaturase
VAKKKKIKQKKKEQDIEKSLNQPWISMRSGLKIIVVTSIAMAVLTAWQVIPSKGWLQGILWGLLFGALIWAIFFGNILITRFLRRR